MKEHFEKQYEKHIAPTELKAEDLVLVRNSAIEMSRDKKSKQRYLGPYEIERKTIGGSYRLKELDGTPLRLKYGARRLLLYINRDHPFMREHMNSSSDQSAEESDSLSDSDSSEMSD